MAQFGDLREKVYTVVRDTGKTFVTERDVDSWLTEAMEDLSSRLRLSQATQTTPAITSGAITLPVDYLDLISLEVTGVTDGYVDFDVDTTTYDLYVTNEDDPGVTIGRIFNGSIEMYPEPANGTAYTLRYWASEKDSLTEFTPSLHIRMVNYARAHALYKEKDFGGGDRYLAMYEDGLPPPNDSSKNHDVGPWTIKPEPNYFETATYLD